MRFSCVVCGQLLPVHIGDARNDLHFCSSQCLDQSGAPWQTVRDWEALQAAYVVQAPPATAEVREQAAVQPPVPLLADGKTGGTRRR